MPLFQSTINTGRSTFKVTHTTQYINGESFHTIINRWICLSDDLSPQSLCDYVNGLCPAAECSVVPTLTRNDLYNLCKPNF